MMLDWRAELHLWRYRAERRAERARMAAAEACRRLGVALIEHRPAADRVPAVGHVERRRVELRSPAAWIKYVTQRSGRVPVPRQRRLSEAVREVADCAVVLADDRRVGLQRRLHAVEMAVHAAPAMAGDGLRRARSE